MYFEYTTTKKHAFAAFKVLEKQNEINFSFFKRYVNSFIIWNVIVEMSKWENDGGTIQAREWLFVLRRTFWLNLIRYFYVKQLITLDGYNCSSATSMAYEVVRTRAYVKKLKKNGHHVTRGIDIYILYFWCSYLFYTYNGKRKSFNVNRSTNTDHLYIHTSVHTHC